MSAHAVAIFAALLVVLAGPVAGETLDARTADSYGIAIADSVRTPAEPVDIDGTSVEVTSTSAHSGYEPIAATVTAPADETVRVELFDANGDRRATVTPTPNGSVTIPTEPLSSGTYYLALRSDDTVRVVERVVVSRFDVSVSVNEAGSTADSLALRIGIIPGGDIPYSDVEVVVTDGVHQSVTSATEVRLGLYEATVDRTALAPGDYTVYARLVGRPGPYVGMSGSVPLTVDGDVDAAQSVETDTATAVGTERSETTAEPSATTTQFPETGIVLLLALLLGVGLLSRVRRRRR